MKYIFDAHSHIQFPIYDNDREEVIKRAQEAGVKMIVAGSQISTSEEAIKLAHKYPEDIWATVGFHPSHAVTRSEQDAGGTTDHIGCSERSIGGVFNSTTRSDVDAGGAVIWHHDANEQKENKPEEFDIKKIKELAMDSKVVGIGECGLDYFRIMNNESGIKNMQKEVFIKMADIAAELKKPIVIHCRPSKNSDDAYLDLLEILKNRSDLEFKVLHCFSGGLEIAKKLAEAGFHFTLGGAVTFPSKTDKKKCAYDEVIKYLPLDRIMTETDCPYIAPVPYRGSRNEPAYVIETAKKIAEIKNISIDEFKEIICRNVGRVFGINLLP